MRKVIDFDFYEWFLNNLLAINLNYQGNTRRWVKPLILLFHDICVHVFLISSKSYSFRLSSISCSELNSWLVRWSDIGLLGGVVTEGFLDLWVGSMVVHGFKGPDFLTEVGSGGADEEGDKEWFHFCLRLFQLYLIN